MGHAQNPVDQIELKLLYTRQLAQFVLDQGLLGGAVHGFNAKTAQASARRGGSAKLDYTRPGRCRAAAMGMAGVVVLVAMIVVVLVRGMNGIAHQVASGKGACCQVKTL